MSSATIDTLHQPQGLPVGGPMVRQWLRGGELTRLKQLVLEGEGSSLWGEYSPHPAVRTFLRTLPNVMKRIEEAHDAARTGDVSRLERVLTRDKGLQIELSKDQSGLSLLHKAVLHGHHPLQRWLLNNYSHTLHLLDRKRRSPLHYAGASPDSEEVWRRLISAGADPTAVDFHGHTPSFYMQHPRKARPPRPQPVLSDKGLVVKPANLRIWIHDRDLGRLQRVLWEGHGQRLLAETTSQPLVKRFLAAVPYIMGSIREVHRAAVENDIETLNKRTAEPAPKELLLSKDPNGLNPLHKAAGLGHREAVDEILKKCPEAVNAPDLQGRTPLHFAAAVKNNEDLYRTLIETGARENIQDKKGNDPGYYKSRPSDLEGPKYLSIVPEAPRTSHIVPPNWDWSLLNTSSSSELHNQDSIDRLAIDSNAESAIETTTEDISENQLNDEVADDLRPEVSEDEGMGSEPAASVEETASPLQCDNIDMEETNEVVEDNKEQITSPGSRLPGEENYGEIKEGNKEEIDGEMTDGNKEENEGGITDGNKEEIGGEMTDGNKLDIGGEMTDGNKEENDGEKDKIYDVENAAVGGVAAPEIPGEDKNEENLESCKSENMAEQEESQNIAAGELIKIYGGIENVKFVENVMKRSTSPSQKKSVDKTSFRNRVKRMIGLGKKVTKEKDNKDNEVETSVPSLELNEMRNVEEQETKEVDKTAEESEGVKLQEAEFQNEQKEVTNGKEGTDNNPDDEEMYDSLEDRRDENMENNGENVQPAVDEITSGGTEEEGEVETKNEEESKNYTNNNEEETILDKDESQDPKADITDKEEEKSEGLRLVEAGDMEGMAEMVLAGQGEALLSLTTDNPEVQLFISNIPQYMAKIERVHRAAREGDLRGVQSSLDRRKFAVARDNSTSLRPTPLHVAALFGRTSVLRYLAGRFPETMHAEDGEGRTPLHYAATLPDNGHFYSLLVTLGADKALLDRDGKTAEYYLRNQGELTREMILEQYQDRPVPIDTSGLNFNRYSDKGAEILREGYPIFKPEEGQYLASSLGEPLIKGLTEVAHLRPSNPVRHLAHYLLDFKKDNPIGGSNVNLRSIQGTPQRHENLSDVNSNQAQSGSEESQEGDGGNVDEDLKDDPNGGGEDEDEEEPEVMDNEEEASDDTDQTESVFKPLNRDEHGQTMLHFAAARSHGRNAMFQLLQEMDANIGLRDSLYRTARDIAQQMEVSENIRGIDRHVVTLAARGEDDRLNELILEGYDHIVDVEDGGHILEIVEERGHTSTIQLIRGINSFEECREKLHRAIRFGSLRQVKEILAKAGSKKRLAIGKNSQGRSSLHVAVLAQQEPIVDYIATKYPATLHLGDNLLRTPLHYAMGLDKVESLSKILISSGAQRVLKDLKGRQPSYYFMNKTDIHKLQDEEEVLRV